MARTHSIIPVSYDELFRHYFPYVKSMVLKYRVPHDVHEDVAMTLLTKFIEKDMLDQFDPERMGSNGRPVQFASFLSGFVVAYVRFYAQKAYQLHDRERLYIDQDTAARADFDASGDGWLDLNGYRHSDDVSGIEYELLLFQVRQHLSGLKVRGKKNFQALFEAALLQIDDRGQVHQKELAEQFGVSEGSMSGWMKELGNHVRKVQG